MSNTIETPRARADKWTEENGFKKGLWDDCLSLANHIGFSEHENDERDALAEKFLNTVMRKEA